MLSCTLFDKYRDNELGDIERCEFDSHLKNCRDCQSRISLLNNLVHALKNEEIRPRDLANKIASRAFQQDKSWDALVVSWLRPGPAFATVAMFIALFSTIWLIADNWKNTTRYSEYQNLMNEADAINLDTRMSKVSNETELILLVEGGYTE
jgi:hypothetical protein